MPGKITELAALTGAAAATTDLIETVDVSDTSMAISGTNKKLTLGNLITFLNANGISGGTTTGSVIVFQATAPADTSLLWADTNEVGIEENDRYIKDVTATAYTVVAADRGKMLFFTSGAPVTVTLPSGVFTNGNPQIDLVRYGAGPVTVVGSGVTVNATPSRTLRAQFSTASLVMKTTAEWLLMGDLA